MSNWVKKTVRTINSKNGFFTFLRAQFSSQVSSQVDFLTSILCVNVFGIYYGLSTLLGNVAGGLLNCFINYKWTFKAKGLYVPHVLIKFILVWFGSIFLNTQGTILFTEFVMKWIPLESMPNLFIENVFLIPKIVVSIIVGLVWNYNMQRIFVYKDINFRKYLAKVGVHWFDKADGYRKSDDDDNQKNMQ
ncbi:GtrA family protein [Dysgonomonas sp. 25]|uniref:GtrA family protein n=1 Tax=Dysgonomonas sp. 25 TaxID=2302933 RepID=UPI0013D722EE|nr:GtrA family protein [Dysgonomonas sp. 25]NDV69061.1 GtrA family protein [Dysgonomonas sp. 25]